MPTDIISLVIYLLPGFLAREIYNYYYPVKKKSDFTQTAWSLIYGIGIFYFVLFVDTKILCGYLEIDKTGFPSFKHIIALIIISIIFSHFLVLWDKFRARIDWKFIFKAPVLPSVWAETIKKAASNEEWAFVFLKDGWIYRGWISQYTYDPDAAFQDFILSNAALFDSEFNHIYDISNAGCVYIDTRNVSRIEFEKGNIMSKNQKNPEEKV